MPGFIGVCGKQQRLKLDAETYGLLCNQILGGTAGVAKPSKSFEVRSTGGVVRVEKCREVWLRCAVPPCLGGSLVSKVVLKLSLYLNFLPRPRQNAAHRSSETPKGIRGRPILRRNDKAPPTGSC